MKRMIMSFGVLCMAFLLFCGTAMAAEPELAPEYKGTVTIGPGTHGDGSYKVTRTSGATAGQLYLVLIQKGESGDTTSAKPLPTKDNVYFIDVKAAEGASVTFDTYPKEMDAGTYIVYLSDYSGDNAGAAKGVAKIVVGGGGGNQGLLGDVDENSKVTPNDAVCVLKIYVGSDNDGKAWTDAQKTVADVDHNGKVTPSDATKILQRYVGSISDEDWK